MNPSKNLMAKLMSNQGKVRAIAFEYKGAEDIIGSANAEAGYWLMFAEGGRAEVFLFHQMQREEVLTSLTEEERAELEAILQAETQQE